MDIDDKFICQYCKKIFINIHQADDCECKYCLCKIHKNNINDCVVCKYKFVSNGKF